MKNTCWTGFMSSKKRSSNNTAIRANQSKAYCLTILSSWRPKWKEREAMMGCCWMRLDYGESEEGRANEIEFEGDLSLKNES